MKITLETTSLEDKEEIELMMRAKEMNFVLREIREFLKESDETNPVRNAVLHILEEFRLL